MYRRLSWMLLPSQVKMHLRLCKLSGVTSHGIVGFMCQSFQQTSCFHRWGFHERPIIFNSLQWLLFFINSCMCVCCHLHFLMACMVSWWAALCATVKHLTTMHWLLRCRVVQTMLAFSPRLKPFIYMGSQPLKWGESWSLLQTCFKCHDAGVLGSWWNQCHTSMWGYSPSRSVSHDA